MPVLWSVSVHVCALISLSSCLCSDQPQFMSVLWSVSVHVCALISLSSSELWSASVHVCALISLSSWHILWFLICGLFQLFFLGLQFIYKFFNSHFPVTVLGLHLFSGTYLNKLLSVWCIGMIITQSKGSTKSIASLLALKMSCFSKILGCGS
jgi:hypothetical protein